VTGSVLIGNAIGEGKTLKAKLYAKLITFQSFVVLMLCFLFLVIFRNSVPQIFTDQIQLITIVSDNLIYAALFILIHGTGLTFGGALRGLGK